MSDSITVTRPGALDVSRSNPRNILYTKGDEFTDGSIREIFVEGQTFSRKELRTAGVWNLTGLQLASSSLEFGPDLSAGAAAGFIETVNPSAADGHTNALIPHVTFDETGSQAIHSPVVDVLKPNDFFVDAVGQITNTTITQLYNIVFGQLIISITHQVGTTGATEPIQYNVYAGTDNTGFILAERQISIEDVIANEPWVIPFNNDLGFSGTGMVFIEMISEASFSLETDVSGNVLTTFSSQQFKTVDVLTGNYLLSRKARMLFTRSGKLLLRKAF